MTLVDDQVQRLDAQLDSLQLNLSQDDSSSRRSRAATAENESIREPSQVLPLSARALTLRRAIQTLSATSAARPLLSKWRLNLTLRDAFEESPLASSQPIPSDQPILNDLEWLVIGKAAIQVHGLVLNELIDQTLPLGDGIWYWTQIRGSYRLTALYTIQTMPLRLLGWGKDIYADARGKLDRVLGEADSSRVSTSGAQASDLQESLLSNWKQFYDLVRESIRERSIGSFQQQVLSPISLCRAEARSKQSSLRSLRERTASALGILVDEAFTFDAEETNNNNNNNNNNGSSRSSKSRDRNGSAVMAQAEWREIVEKSIALLESVLKNVGADGTPGANLDDTVFAAVEADPDLAADDRARSPSRLALKLQGVLNEHLEREKLQFQAAARQYGIPSPSIRYWLPATILVLSSSTILRIIFSREAAILTWFRELGQTVVDFWANWIVSPAEKIIRTIRHDEGSEVALMSKRSLQGDRDSLERMVVDFAVDNPQCGSADGNASRLDRQAIEAIRAGIKEGDLTPVLRAYERDIRHPLRGAVVGNLARALLIQVQKTKVDVEVAISGIDSLLKSQELVFGFVGLTPSILITLGLTRWLTSTFGNRRYARSGTQKGRLLRTLRHIDRLLTAATPSATGMLSYREHGLLLVEIHELRTLAGRAMPGPVLREFLEELDDLAELRTGVERQLLVVKRVRWGFARYIS